MPAAHASLACLERDDRAPASAPRMRPRASELRDGLAKLLPELHARALRMTRNPSLAEDLVQDAVERALRFETHFEPGTNLRAWVQRILFSVFITKCRRSRRERHALDDLGHDPCAWTAPEAPPCMVELSPSTARAVEALPPAFREAIELVDLGEVSYKDAAAMLGIPVGTVMSRLHRGRRLLAASLSPARDVAQAA